MLIRCPACDHARQVNPEKIPPKAEFATCPKCRHRFRFRATPLQEESPPHTGDAATPKDIWDAVDSLPNQWKEEDERTTNDTDTPEDRTTENRHPPEDANFTRDLGRLDDNQPWEDDQKTYNRQKRHHGTPVFLIPWENPGRYGFANSFLQTILMALLQPTRFFPSLTPKPPLPPAFLFFLLTGVIHIFCMRFWMTLWLNMAGPEYAAKLGQDLMHAAGMAQLPMDILIAPLRLGLNLLITTWVMHIVIWLLAPSKANFAKTFKIASYAGAAFVLSLFPILGPILAYIWYIALLLVGGKTAYDLSWGKAVLAILPLVALVLFVINALLALIHA